MRTQWRWGLSVLVMLMVLVGFYRWIAITDSLGFEWDTPTEQPKPGEVVAVMNPQDECVPGERGDFWYRTAAFGRWRITHHGQDRNEPAWWELGPGGRGSVLGCNSTGGSSFSVRIPPDVDWSPVAVCTIDDQCVKIEVDLSDA